MHEVNVKLRYNIEIRFLKNVIILCRRWQTSTIRDQWANKHEYVISYVLWLLERQMVSLTRMRAMMRGTCVTRSVSECHSVPVRRIHSVCSVWRVSVAVEVWRRRDKSRDPVPISTTQRPWAMGSCKTRRRRRRASTTLKRLFTGSDALWIRVNGFWCFISLSSETVIAQS